MSRGLKVIPDGGGTGGIVAGRGTLDEVKFGMGVSLSLSRVVAGAGAEMLGMGVVVASTDFNGSRAFVSVMKVLATSK